MPKRDPETPHTQPSAPVKSPDTTEDAAPVRRAETERGPARQAGGGTGEDGHMPKGADEPGAGL